MLNVKVDVVIVEEKMFKRLNNVNIEIDLFFVGSIIIVFGSELYEISFIVIVGSGRVVCGFLYSERGEYNVFDY